MRRKDMVPGTIYAIQANGMTRPGVVLDSTYEKVKVRVWWRWPQPENADETDYLDPQPDLLSPLSKYDDKTVKTSDVLTEWEPWALAEKARKARVWAEHLAQEEAERAARQAEQDRNVARIEALRPMLEGAVGYLNIDRLTTQATKSYYWSQYAFSAEDVMTLLEQIAPRTFDQPNERTQSWTRHIAPGMGAQAHAR